MNTNNPNNSEILELYQDLELKSKVEELLDACTAVMQKEPVYGFHHRFYVPGVIGLVQQFIVEKKMNEFVCKPFYKDQNYFEFGSLFDSSKGVCEMLVQSKEKYSTDDELYSKQCETLIKVYELLLTSWVRSCPEIATYCNHKYTEDTLISVAGIFNLTLSENLKQIGYVESEKQSESGGNFKKEMQGVFYQIAGYFLNCLLLALVFGLGSLIFS